MKPALAWSLGSWVRWWCCCCQAARVHSYFNFQSLQWETVVYLPVVSLLVGFLFTFRLVQSVRSRLITRHEKAARKNTGCTDWWEMSTHWQMHAAKVVCRDGDIFRECQARKWVNKCIQSYWQLQKIEKGQQFWRQTQFWFRTDQERLMQSKQEEEMEEMLKILKSLEVVMRTTSQGLFQTSQGGQAPSLMVSSLGVDLSINCAVPHPPLRPPNMPGCIHQPPPHSQELHSEWWTMRTSHRLPVPQLYMHWAQWWAPPWLTSFI